MNMRLKFLHGVLFVLQLFLLCGIAFADALTPTGLSNGGAVTRDRQLTEISQILQGGRGGYIDFGFYYTPSRNQLPLETEYGEHKGYAFRHHLAGFAAGEVAMNKYVGFMLWFDRSGWDSEDFFFFPHYSDFSLIRSTTTWGLNFTESALDLTFAAGMQHSNTEIVQNVYPEESDSLLYSWAYLRWGKLSVRGSAYKTDWRNAHVSLNLESRSIYGGRSSGPLTYLPNIDVGFYNGDKDDSIRVTWEQNLYNQSLYGKVTFDFPDGKFHEASLVYYPDPSRMIGFEASCIKRRGEYGSDDLLWGGAIDLLFMRFAYNAAYDYDNFFGAKGTFLAEIKFSLATIDGFLFGRGAAKTAPMETDIIKAKNKREDAKSESVSLDPMHPGVSASDGNASGTKVLEARGIRYGNDSGAKGGSK